jgi:hypothetical protein
MRLALPTKSPTGHDPTYIAYKGFMAGLLHDWTVRTENPWEANLFYVPALTYAYSSNTGDVVEHLRRVMGWVRDAHPFFNRTAGRDHFMWLPNDRWGQQGSLDLPLGSCVAALLWLMPCLPSGIKSLLVAAGAMSNTCDTVVGW